MAVIENKATEIGDVLIIRTEVPIVGIVTLLSFLDDTEGEVGSKYFQKTFRYSVDGINFSPYTPLTNAAIQGIEINPVDTLIIEYVYQRSGLDNSGSLVWNSTTLDGDFVEIPCGEAYENSMYNQYFGCNNLCSLNWSINVLEKLYQGGILPSYVQRGSNSSNLEDRDFIDYWRSVTHFFAIFVCLARAFSEFYTDDRLLKHYLKCRNLFFCDNLDYQGLYYLMQNYYDEIRQRGTCQIIKEKNAFEFISDCPDDEESVSVSISASASVSGSEAEGERLKFIDGELLRLICYDICDEFMFCLAKPEKLGWCIGHSSPMYAGMSNQNCVNKAYEDTRDIKDLTKYPLINPDNCAIIMDDGKEVMHINNVANGQVAGIGNLDFSKAMKIDPQLDYEITFVVKQDYDVSLSISDSNNDGVQDGNLSFGCFAFNCFGALEGLLNIQDNTPEDMFFERISLQRDDKYIYIRGMIFNYKKYPTFSPLIFYKRGEIVSLSGVYYRCIKPTTTGIVPGTTPLSFTFWEAIPINELNPTLKNSLNIGNNLKFRSSVNYILPYIVLDNEKNDGGELFIWDVKVKPVSTPYSHGFIQQPNFVHIWMKNRNGEYSDLQIRQIMRKFLMPYNSTFQNIMLEPSEADLAKAELGDYNDDFNNDF